MRSSSSTRSIGAQILASEKRSNSHIAKISRCEGQFCEQGQVDPAARPLQARAVGRCKQSEVYHCFVLFVPFHIVLDFVILFLIDFILSLQNK